MILETARLRLRAQEISDFRALFAILRDAETMRFWGHGIIARAEVVKDLIAEQQAAMAEGFCRYWTVMEGEDAIGSVDLSLIRDGAAELGFVLRRDRWGLGLASEAAAAVVAHGFTILGLHRLVAASQEDNFPARQVLEKAGFRQVERREARLPGGARRLCAFYRRDR